MQSMPPDDDESLTEGRHCVCCFNVVSPGRASLGYGTCTTCGEKIARQVKHTIVPLPKSNYIYAHTAEDVLSPYSHKGNR